MKSTMMNYIVILTVLYVISILIIDIFMYFIYLFIYVFNWYFFIENIVWNGEVKA